METVNIILAGDVGGTKTLLALFNAASDLKRPIAEERFASRDYNALAPIIGQFLKKNGNIQIQAASFGVAGRGQGWKPVCHFKNDCTCSG